MNELRTFSFEQKFPVRITDRDGSPWFVAKDVCDALELSNSRDALKNLDNDERSSVAFSDVGENGHKIPRKFNLISESGLYALILRSNKPKAREFRRWVTGEVLPSIRRTGSYIAETVPAPVDAPPGVQLLITTVRMLETLNRRIVAGEEPSAPVLKYAGLLASTSGALLLKNFVHQRAGRRYDDDNVMRILCAKARNAIVESGGELLARDLMRKFHLKAAVMERMNKVLLEAGDVELVQISDEKAPRGSWVYRIRI